MSLRCVAVEGLNGCGKSSLCSSLQRRLGSEIDDVRVLKLPGYATEPYPPYMFPCDVDESECSKTRSMLVGAQLAAQIATIGSTPDTLWLVDRYLASWVVYEEWVQGAQWVETLLALLNPPLPLITVFIDVPVSVALSRVKRLGSLDTYEQQDLSFWAWLSEHMRDASSRYSEHTLTVSGEVEIETTAERLVGDILTILR